MKRLDFTSEFFATFDARKETLLFVIACVTLCVRR